MAVADTGEIFQSAGKESTRKNAGQIATRVFSVTAGLIARRVIDPVIATFPRAIIVGGIVGYGVSYFMEERPIPLTEPNPAHELIYKAHPIHPPTNTHTPIFLAATH